MSESKLDLEPCAICLEDIKEPHKTKCNHVFCKDCIVKWRKKKKDCPLCRTKIPGILPSMVELDNLLDKCRFLEKNHTMQGMLELMKDFVKIVREFDLDDQ